MTTISQLMRESSMSDHKTAENASFIKDLMAGELSAADYTRYLNQMVYVYQAMEKKLPDAAPLPFAPELKRFDSMVADLQKLGVENWSETPMLPATAEYVARIEAIGGIEDVRLLAHHYTRYLGDLSGGQMIAKRVKKQFGFERAGIAFYDFTELGDLGEFKQAYRGVLDVLGESLDEAERERMVAEVRAAYRFNSDVFVDMKKANEARKA